MPSCLNALDLAVGAALLDSAAMLVENAAITAQKAKLKAAAVVMPLKSDTCLPDQSIWLLSFAGL